MKKAYITPSTDFVFTVTQDIMFLSIEEIFNDVIDPHENDLDSWEIKKTGA